MGAITPQRFYPVTVEEEQTMEAFVVVVSNRKVRPSSCERSTREACCRHPSISWLYIWA
jgi:hypothetical protein